MYVTFADTNATKTRKSSIKLKRNMIMPRIVDTDGEKCPVDAFLKNLSDANQVNLKRALHCTLPL